MNDINTATLLQFLFVAIFTAAATASDLRTRRIPNWLTVSAAIAGLVFHAVSRGVEGLIFSLGGFGVGFGILFVLWLIGGGGGGDVKLMGAIGAWLGPTFTFAVFLLSVLFSVICMAVVVVIGAMKRVSQQNDQSAKPKPLLKRTIPYALPCGLSTWSVLLLKLFASH